MQQQIGVRPNVLTNILSRCNPWRKERERLNQIKSEVSLTIVSCEQMRDSIREVVESNHFSEWLIYESQQGEPLEEK